MHIVLENVSKEFKNQLTLQDISMSFQKGMIHGIIGRNGSGKTVLLKCIAGILPITSGKITVDDKILGKDIDTPRKLGIIIESPGFLPNYSGLSNLSLLAMINRRINRKDAAKTMELVGLDPKSKKHVGKYSLGMRQRLGIAQAIMEDPDLLLLDEPMNGLDNDGAQEMRVLFQKLKDHGKTILLASHDHDDIDILCDTVSEMDKGTLICRRG